VNDLLYSSILWPLMVTLPHVRGDIIEFGIGDYSTRFLRLASFRRVMSLEIDPAWVDKFSHFDDGFIRIHKVENWDAVQLNRPVGLAIVDHAPAYRRIIDARRVAPWADLVLMHDTEAECYGWSRLRREFDWWYDCYRMTPWTSIAGRGPRPEWIERELTPGEYR
jgi:hypothetical protein